MKSKQASRAEDCEKHLQVKEYTHLQEGIDNLPYLIMMTLGAAVFLIGGQRTAAAWTGAGLYFLYGIGGAFWIIVFVCPYCHYYGTRLCPCGYGQIAARFLPQKDGDRFAEKFKKHIPVIVPLWFMPLIGGGYFLWRDFSWGMLILLAGFAINSFVVLPLLSMKYGCAHCPQKASCPWMKKKAAADDEIFQPAAPAADSAKDVSPDST